MLYKFDLVDNTAEVTKNICSMKDEGTVDQSKVTRWFKKFHEGCKNFDDQARSDRLKTMDSKMMLQPIEAHPASNTQRVSGEHSISYSDVIDYLRNLSKSIQSCKIMPHVLLKYCKTFDTQEIVFHLQLELLEDQIISV